MKRSPSLILFWVYFYVGWYGIILLGKHQDSALSLLFSLPPALYLIWKKELTIKVCLRATALVIVGLGFDILSNGLGWISFVPNISAPLAPIWLCSLWILYFCYLPMLAKLFQNRLLLAMAMGAVFGPLSYLSGTHFSLLLFSGTYAIFIYALFWGIHFLITARFLWKLEIKTY